MTQLINDLGYHHYLVSNGPSFEYVSIEIGPVFSDEYVDNETLWVYYALTND